MRYVPPLRASTVEARLQLEMRAKTVALERVLLDGVVVKFDAPVPVTGTAPLHLGSALVCKEGGDVRAYIVTPTGDKFLLPIDDGFDLSLLSALK